MTCPTIKSKDIIDVHAIPDGPTTNCRQLRQSIPHVAAVSGHCSWVSLKRYTHIRESGDKYAGWAGVQMAISTN
jgi:hypothetical protein